MSTPTPLSAVVSALQSADEVLLFTHEYPDGDGIGSMLALRLGLIGLGKQVECAMPHPCPQKYQFLPGAAWIRTDPPSTPFRCAVALDCDGEARLGPLLPAFRAAELTVHVDHHRAEGAFGQVSWCDPTQAATALMIHQVLEALGVALTAEIATCLYTGLAADTGVFRFQNTSAQALITAGALVAVGADPYELGQRVGEEMPLPKALLLGRALTGVRVLCEGALLVAALEAEDFAAAGALPEHTDGLIDELRRVAGVRVTVLLREQEPGRWRASLRGVGEDVASICRKFGGGGHRLAAGCELWGEREQVVETIVQATRPLLEGANDS